MYETQTQTRNRDARDEFLRKVEDLISQTLNGPRFKGQTQAVKGLRRVTQLSALNK